MQKGLIHIYTGTGKGKTTAAVGLAARALGNELRVTYCYFLKEPELYGYHELESLKKLGATVMGMSDGHPHFSKEDITEKLQTQMKEALVFLTDYLKKQTVDLLIMDEILIAIRDGFLEEALLLDFIKQKPEGTELVMTGRGATKSLIEQADYVSEVNKIKHPYDHGLLSRPGIEF